MSPYRRPAPGPPERPAAQLVYTPGQREDSRGSLRGTLLLVGPGSLTGAILWAFVDGGVALGGAALAAGISAAVWWRTSGRAVVLRVNAEELHVAAPRRPAFRARLSDLDDVQLETKTVEREIEGGNANLGATYLNPRIAPPTDTNRIVLAARGRPPFALTREFHGHVDTLEWFSKIRVFLRSCGWTPADERDDSTPDEDEDEDTGDDA